MGKNRKSKKSLLDSYTMRARLYPALIVALPLALSTLSWFHDDLTGCGTLWGLIVWCGGTILLAQFGRDMGLKKEEDLFFEWSGAPTTRRLRHRDAPNKVTLKRYHEKLKKLLPKTNIPNPDEELADTAAADEIYDSCVAFLREKTRDKTEFPLVFEENCNYGFRRNLWGMKKIGITVTLICVAAVIVQIVLSLSTTGITFSRMLILYGLINVLLLLAWLLRINKEWVRATAESYAERLLASIESIT